jgi:hypothetical protein
MLRIADSEQAPKWNNENPDAAEYAAKRITAR